ncbi:MAG TPA: GAF domain-containing protein [Anaerolineales bacterium]|nr:GAF domain-containing protein [Anaerolineales bacterium]HNB34623.1 GAF domain-containing protein [Anaerolineales bacterium]
MTRIPFNFNPFTSNSTTQEVYRLWRERFIRPLLFGVVIFGAAALLPAIRVSNSILINSIFIATYLLIALVAIVRFSYLIRISAFLLGIYVVGFSELLTHGILGDGLFFFLAVIVFSTMLLSPRAGIISIGINLITFAIMGWFMQNKLIIPFNPYASPAQVEDWLSASAAIIMFGVVIIIGFRQLEIEFAAAQKQIDSSVEALREERNNLENRVQERTVQLRRINDVGRAIAAILAPNELLERAAKLIQNEFDFYYTSFYLLDSTGQWLELKEAQGEAGKILKENKHRLSVESKSIIATAVRTKSVQILTDSAQIRTEHPLFPYTRSMIVVPLVLGETIFGALEMHASKENSFLQQDIDAYQNMANGIAVSIENSRLFQEAQQSIMEMQATQRQYLQGAWSSLTSEKDLDYALGDGDLADNNPIEIPLALRNQIIGQIELANTAEWTNEQKSLIEAIAVQATLALENARLVEESQATATQERITNEIISKIWTSANMDGILQTTVRELGRNLEASEVEIEILMDGQSGE